MDRWTAENQTFYNTKRMIIMYTTNKKFGILLSICPFLYYQLNKNCSGFKYYYIQKREFSCFKVD